VRAFGWRILAALVIALIGAVVSVVEAALQQRALTIQTVITAGCLIVGLLLVQSWLAERRPPAGREPGLPASLAERQERMARIELIADVRRLVEDGLEQSLTRIVDTRLGVVAEAEGYVLLRRGAPERKVARGRPIRETYEDVEHRLLVLGEPGTGKTELLLELALSLLEDAERSTAARVPAVFHLPSWAVARLPLEEWLTERLVQDYGVAPTVARNWLRAEHVIPLLDELDQVAEPYRTECLAAVNRFQEAYGHLPLVVCSRVQEYEELPARLDLPAIVVPLLSRAHVRAYVRRARRQLIGLADAIRDDPDLCDLLTTPLLLSVAALTYQGDRVVGLQRGGTLIERRRRLLADYVGAMLERRPPAGLANGYAPELTTRWLAWLAQAMQAHGQMVFYPDRLQPDWLPAPGRRRLATAGVTAACVVLYLLVTGVLTAAALAIAALAGHDRLAPQALAGLLLPRLTPLAPLTAAGAAALALALHDREVQPMRWSRLAFQRALPAMAVQGALAGALVAAGVALLVQPSLRPSVVLLGSAGLGIPIGVGVSLWFATGAGYAPDDSAPSAPGRDVDELRRAALVNAIFGVLVAGPVIAAAAGLALHLSVGQAGVATVAIAGLFAVPLVALFAGLRRGGAAYARHRVVRWLLARDGHAAPDLVQFLTYAAGLNLLRREGGGFQFTYPLLRRYFEEQAALESGR